MVSGLQAQDSDTTRKYQDSTAQAPFFKKKAVRAVIVPTLLIGYGLSTIKDNGLCSNLLKDERDNLLDGPLP